MATKDVISTHGGELVGSDYLLTIENWIKWDQRLRSYMVTDQRNNTWRIDVCVYRNSGNYSLRVSIIESHQQGTLEGIIATKACSDGGACACKANINAFKPFKLWKGNAQSNALTESFRIDLYNLKIHLFTFLKAEHEHSYAKFGSPIKAAVESGNEMFADVMLNSTDGTLFPAHKVVLAGRSKGLAELLRCLKHVDREKDQIDIPFSSKIVKGLLEFLYNDTVRIDAADAKEWFQVAEFAKTLALKLEVEKQLSRNLNLNNVIFLFKIAMDNSASALKTEAIQFFKGNEAEITDTAEFEKFTQTSPGYVMSLFVETARFNKVLNSVVQTAT